MALPKPLRALWGDLSTEELSKFSILSAAFFMLIGSYWLLRSMKDAIFTQLVGYKYQPYAKMTSLVVVIVAVLFYNKLINLLKRTTLVYTVMAFFGIGFFAIAYFLGHQELVCTAVSPDSFMSPILSCIPGKTFGWIIYCFLESFGSISVALFLSFVASVMTSESAKRGYGMMYSFGQIGQILGAYLVTAYAASLGFSWLFALGGALICSVPFFIRWYVSVHPEQLAPAVKPGEKKKDTGIFEGLRLIISQPYIAGLLVVTTAYEIISTIVEYQMGMCVTEVFPINTSANMAWIKGIQGMSTGVLAIVFSLFGTSFFMRRFGLKFCLMAFPAMIGLTLLVTFGLYFSGVNAYILMWTFLVAVVIFKGLSYTLNNPSKEVMYIPTSKDVKFKAKSWIDSFGNRSTKAVGASVNAALKSSLPLLITAGTVISLGIVGVWLVVAAFVGNTYNTLQKDNKIIQ
jgi:AAA family ATP:ADP antiporter